MPTAKTYGYEVLLKDAFSAVSKKIIGAVGIQQRHVQQLGKAWNSTGATVVKAASAYLGVRAVYARANALIKESIQLAAHQIDMEAKLGASFKTTGGLSAGSAAMLKERASAIQATTTVGDEAIIQAQAMLGTFPLTAQAVAELSDEIVDYGVAMYGTNVTGEQLQQISIQLGKALSGMPSVLRRVGVTFDATQESMLKTGTESQKLAAIQDVLQGNFGGMAAALRGTVHGAWIGLQNDIKDAEEAMGRNALESEGLQQAINEVARAVRGLGDDLNGPSGIALVEDFAIASLKTADGILHIAHAMGEVKSASIGFGQLLGQSLAVVSLRLEDTLRNNGDPAALSPASAAAMRELDKTWKSVSSDIGQTFEESTFGGISEGINKAISAIEANRGQRIEMPAGVAGGSAPDAQRTGGAAKGGPFDYQSAQRTTEAMAELNAEFLAWQQTNADTLKANDLLLASGGDVEAVRRQFGELEAAKTEIAQEADAERYANWLATEQEKAQAWQDAFQPRIDSFAEYAGAQFDIISGALSRGIADAFIDGEFRAEELGREVLRSAVQVTIQAGLQWAAYAAIKGVVAQSTAVQLAGTSAALGLEQAMLGVASARLAVETQIAAVRAAGSVAGFGLLPFHSGGLIRHSGGPVVAHSGMYLGGGLKSDEVPVIAQRGEYVVRKEAVRDIGVSNLERMNRHGRRGTIDRNGSRGGGVNATFHITVSGGGSARETAENLGPEIVRYLEREQRRGALKLGA